MEFQDNMPIYVQIANNIKEQIISGKLKDGEKIKSVREYSVFYEVTALTMNRAMQLLETEGVVQTKKGVGSFITAGVQPVLKTKMIGAQVQEFIYRMRNMDIPKADILHLIQEALAND